MRRVNGSSRDGRAQRGLGNRRVRWAAMTVAPIVAAVCTHSAIAQQLIWDASGISPAGPTDGGGNWNTTTNANWSNGAADSTWVNGDIAVIGSNNGAAGTITIDD